MNRYQKKVKIRPMRYIKHLLYRLQHDFSQVIALPRKYIEYGMGCLTYTKSPMYKGLSYRKFSAEHGRYGEFQLWRKARLSLGKECKWLCNLYLPKKDGTTCEVDLVAISRRGIFVFESKNYSGTIYGREDQPYWYQMVRKDIRTLPKKSSFFNPIMQNGMHARALCKILPEHKDIVFPIVVFGNRCRLKMVKWDRKKANVAKCKFLGIKLRKYPKTKLTPNEIETIHLCLSPYTNIGYQDKMKHIENIQEKHNKTLF